MKVLLDRVQHRDTRIEELEAEKRRLSEAQEGNCQKLKKEEEKNFSLGKDLEFVVNEVSKMKDECLELKGAAELKAKRAVQLEAELEESVVELRKKDAVLERSKRRKLKSKPRPRRKRKPPIATRWRRRQGIMSLRLMPSACGYLNLGARQF